MESAEKNLKVGCVVMAAGNARRFGANKLNAKLDGQPLFLHTLRAISTNQLDAVAVVTQYPEILQAAEAFHYTALRNEHPELGVSHTIALGLSALTDCNGILFQVSDQPLLRQESVAALVSLWRKHPDSIAALSHGGLRGNPCLFPARLFPELLALTGDRGGSAVIRNHPDDLLLIEVPAEELSDVDTPEAMEQLIFHT